MFKKNHLNKSKIELNRTMVVHSHLLASMQRLSEKEIQQKLQAIRTHFHAQMRAK